MSAWKNTVCPRCSAVNGPGAPACHSCGAGLLRLGLAARPVDDDEDDEPRRPIKKKPRPIDDDEDDEPRRPVKKRPRDEDDDDLPPVRKKRRRDEEDEEEGESLRDNTILNMFLPVGVSIWAMGSFLCGIVGVLAIGGGFALAYSTGNRTMGLSAAGVGTALCFLALPLGGLSFILRPKKTTYGGVTGYMRAVIGLLLGLVGFVGGPVMLYVLYHAVLR